MDIGQETQKVGLLNPQQCKTIMTLSDHKEIQIGRSVIVLTVSVTNANNFIITPF
jgi:hypothetical protein